MLILAIEDDGAGIRFSVSPRLVGIVAKTDLSYIQDLLADLPELSGSDPSATFEQLSSLAVGPLRVQKLGTLDADADYIEACCSDFVPL